MNLLAKRVIGVMAAMALVTGMLGFVRNCSIRTIRRSKQPT